MADTNTQTTAPKADTPAAAPRAAEKAADAAPKAATQAAPAAAKPAAAATAKVAAAPVKAAARTAKAPAKRAGKRTARAATAKRTTRSAPARRAPARRAATKASATATSPAAKRAATRAARAAIATTTTTTTNVINQGTRTMKNEAKQAADRFQAVFGDVNERARTAIERNTRFAEELTELGKGNVEALVASTKVAAKGVETIGQEVAELSRKTFEDASAALKGFADVKSPTDFFRLQSDFARNQFDLVVAESSKLSEKMIKVAGQVAEPITNRYSVAAERVRSAAAF